MKKRLKILMTIIMLCLCVGTSAFAVYSATSYSTQISANVGFQTGDQLLFAVKGSVSGAQETVATYYYDPEGYYGAPTTNLLEDGWNIGALDFDNTQTNLYFEITISLEVVNLSTSQIAATVTNTVPQSSFNIALQNQTLTAYNASNDVTTYSSADKKTCTITISPTDIWNELSLACAFKLSLS